MANTQRSPGFRFIMLGTYDDPNWVQLQWQIWTRSAQRWVIMPDHLERYEKSRDGTPMT
jgi:hypothetical protein